MTWRDNALALDALETQGYYDEDEQVLRTDLLASAIRDVFLRDPVSASADDPLDKTQRLIRVGLTRYQLLDAVFPDFRNTHELSDDEAALYKKNPREHPQLEERSKAIADIATLLWGTLGKTGRAGAVQVRLVQLGLLLIEAKNVTRDGSSVSLKAATDDHDLILEHYVRPRGDQLVKISGGVRDDCSMVGMTFEGITDRMKRELGSHVTTAVGHLMQVAVPDFAALNGSSSGEQAKAISTSAQKG